MSKVEEVRQIRDRAVELVQRIGEFAPIGGTDVKCLVGKSNGLMVIYRTPLQQMRLTTDEEKYERARQGQIQPAFALDIYDGKKVMSIEWNEDDVLEVISFQRGAWEQTLSCQQTP